MNRLSPELAARSITDLCRERDAVEAELHRRAIATVKPTFGDSFVGSRTIVSVDGSKVIVAFIDKFSLRTIGVAHVEFPDPFVGVIGSFGSALPLAVYEGGARAVADFHAAEQRQRDAERAEFEREEYKRLREKYG